MSNKMSDAFVAFHTERVSDFNILRRRAVERKNNTFFNTVVFLSYRSYLWSSVVIHLSLQKYVINAALFWTVRMLKLETNLTLLEGNQAD